MAQTWSSSIFIWYFAVERLTRSLKWYVHQSLLEFVAETKALNFRKNEQFPTCHVRGTCSYYFTKFSIVRTKPGPSRLSNSIFERLFLVSIVACFAAPQNRSTKQSPMILQNSWDRTEFYWSRKFSDNTKCNFSSKSHCSKESRNPTKPRSSSRLNLHNGREWLRSILWPTRYSRSHYETGR